jgi:hypothetical protein
MSKDNILKLFINLAGVQMFSSLTLKLSGNIHISLKIPEYSTVNPGGRLRLEIKARRISDTGGD